MPKQRSERFPQPLEEAEAETICAELREAARITDEYVATHGHPFGDWIEAFSREADTDG